MTLRSKARSRRLRVLRTTALGGLLAAGTIALPAWSAGMRGDLRTNLTFVETRGLERRTVPAAEVPGDGVYRQLADGTIVTCIPGEDECYWYTQGGIESSLPVSEDLRLSAWTDVQGLSARLHVRGRYGSDDFWPRSEEKVELVVGYVEFDREAYRLRAGRTTKHAGLGYYEFDGGSALWRASPVVSLELYGGRSLARGTSQPLTGFLLEEIDEFAPSEPGVLLGGEAQLQLPSRSRLALLYQRELRQDRAALYEERGALDGRFALPGVSLDTQVDYDFAMERVQDARLRVDSSRWKGYRASGALRYRRPHFSLWTIWEAFAPVGYREAWTSLSWTDARGLLGLQASTSYRTYDDTDVILTGIPVRDDGWQVDLGARWQRDAWRFDGTYRVDWGYGAAETQVELGAGKRLGPLDLGARGFASQQVREFRRGEQWIFGGGLEAGLEHDAWTFDGSFGLHRLSFDNRADYSDWSQKRARLAVGYRFGSDPGLRVRRISAGAEKEASR